MSYNISMADRLPKVNKLETYRDPDLVTRALMEFHPSDDFRTDVYQYFAAARREVPSEWQGMGDGHLIQAVREWRASLERASMYPEDPNAMPETLKMLVLEMSVVDTILGKHTAG